MIANLAPRRLAPALGLALFTFCLALVAVPARAGADAERGGRGGKPAFSALYVFGDSLSDTGRTFAATGYPPPPYAGGRFSNGAVWVEQLAPQLGLAYNPATNFSWGGAKTGYTNVLPGLPGLRTQLDAYVASLGAKPRADKDALYVVFGGANDFFAILGGGDPAAIVPAAVNNLTTIVATLQSLGARHILVVDLPDIGLTPRAQLAGAGASATFLSAWFNSLLDAQLDALRCDVMRVSSFDLLQACVNDPAAYGFTNVTVPGILNPATAGTALFWDDIHPTTRMHTLLAAVIEDEVTDGPGHGHHHGHGPRGASCAAPGRN